MNRRAVAAAALWLCAVVACGDNRPPSAAGGLSRAANPTSAQLNSATAADVVAAIGEAGLPVPNPHDVTSRDCPSIGCLAKTETDTVSVMVFPNTGRAQLYAGSTHGVILVENVVLSFAASVPVGQRADYEGAAERAIR